MPVYCVLTRGCHAEMDATSIPIPGVRGEILELIAEYMTHHAGTEPAIIEKPLRSKNMKDVVKDQWDATFIDTIGNERQKLYDVILVRRCSEKKDLPIFVSALCV